jgi:ferredoxin-type protein NapH
MIPWPYIRGAVTIVFFLMVGFSVFSDQLIISTSFVGFGEWGIACPIGVVQVLAASREIAPALLIGGILGLLVIVFTGRAFCSWICPGRWIFNRGPAKNSKPWKHRKLAQKVIAGGIVGASFVCHNPVFCSICPAGVACRGALAAGTGGSIFPTLGWFGIMLGTEWTLGKSWCRDLCPLGAALSQISRLNPFIKVKKDSEICRPCVLCQKSCPEGLNLAKDTDFSSCTKCFACQTACPRGAVTIQFTDIQIKQ